MFASSQAQDCFLSPAQTARSATPYMMQADARDDALTLPLTEKNELLSMGGTVPGHPLISADDHAEVDKFLEAELSTLRLKRVYSLLFLASNRDNVSPLHHQVVKGRRICITERPDLHLCWYYERVFVKPIPKCLLSYAFWARHLVDTRGREDGGDSLRAEAEGFLRTYARLICHESDLHLAKEHKLVPETLTWDRWCSFIHPFRFLRDKDVAERYHYGEIRLTRVNFWYSLRYGHSYFQANHNYATFFGRFGAPYIFVFGAVTVLLTALQTGLAVYPQWGIYNDLASRIVPFTMILTLVGLGLLPMLFMFFQFRELFLFIFVRRPLS
ncbi:hypothetical protein NM208_g352 [Fusarium decemcellulare]|uniref:Uncharacterized protein n=1 Tax=Fusarium decemcellulare TaxID=57161 RepID=A0ACC1SZL6_9HYPO|nr:hypothetical protein NM208_g352 [Fusarium decemcellulare]